MPQASKEPFIKRALKDPLFHFLILGGLLFTAVSLFGAQPKQENEIIITRAGQKHLADLFALTWQREATPNELKNLVEEHIKEEVYYREALALGLDENDTIVRRRLRQKLEFMQEDLSSLAVPSTAELKTYYDAHQEKYETDHVLSFKQILVSTKKLNRSEFDALETSQKIAAGATPESLSRSSLLPISMNLETEKSITGTFGLDFFEQISDWGPRSWSGPVHSGFGTHLVNISLNQRPKPLTFEQAQAKVAIDFTQSLREQASENYYKDLREQYRIVIKEPE